VLFGAKIMALSVTAAPVGKQTQTVNFGGTSLEVFTYRPSGEIKGVLLNFHGSSRGASSARDAAIKIAEEKGYYVVAPLFDKAHFGDSSLYQQGGIIQNGKLASEEDWTISIVNDIADWANAKVGTDNSDDMVLFGHSAGGQFLSRIAAYGDDSTFDKMIISNPSTYVWPSLTEKATYGFGGGYFTAQKSEALLKDYLADPITIYLGGEDDNTDDADLATGATAMRQGEHRLERGLNAYEAAKDLAASKGWDFNWELVIAPGVGHTAGGMLKSTALRDAIKITAPAQSPMPDADSAPIPTPVPTPVPVPSSKIYDFNTISEANNAKTIANYVKGDKFDFSTIDADTQQSGNQTFKFLGFAASSAFTKNGEEIRIRHDLKLNETHIYGNTDHDTGYEFRLEVKGIHNFTAADFIL
jgi:pimeloyl-ACP methyl ester carboxylesterase